MGDMDRSALNASRSGGKGKAASRELTVPPPPSVDEPSASSSPPLTTVMLRNLPNRYTRAMLLELLDEEGFAGRYNFVYLPIDFKTHCGLGYAFVDLHEPEVAEQLRQHFEGFSRWCMQSD